MMLREWMLAVCSLSGAHAAVATERSNVEFLNSGKVLPAGLSFRQAVRVGDVVYLSGQVGIAAARD